MIQLYKNIASLSIISLLVTVKAAYSDEKPVTRTLEEVTVTAQKRDQSLQDTPIAISVFSSKQLEMSGITSLDMLSNGTVPSLNIMPMGATSSTLITTIRGNGPTDTTQVTREGAVAFYQNGIYTGRSQGLIAETINIERIEVLRGPQGTLFGRNAVGGAINIISKAPTGKFEVKQKIGLGNYDAFRSVTHVDLPTIANIKASIDYVHTERDGWVDNTAPNKRDYNEYKKNGGRINLLWQASDALSIDYAYDQSDIESTQMYFQLYQGPGIIDVESGRATTTRFPVNSLEPTAVDQYSHTVNASWSASENIDIKSFTSHRKLEEDTNSNWAGALNSNGLIFAEDIEQEQLSQEFQITGKSDRLDWASGIYYFKENVNQDTTLLFTLENDLTPITPTTTHPVFGFDIPVSFVDATAESQAVYGQLTWAALMDTLYITVGARYSRDEKSGNRFQFVDQPFDLDSDHFDTSIIFDYRWHDNFSTYIKRSTAYKAGGVSVRSTNFLPYAKETVKTWEIGAKSELWNQRLRLNAAAFWGDYEDMQIDVADPNVAAVTETINATKNVGVDGVELDVELVLFDSLVIGLSYTYLDGDMPLQPNPLAAGAATQQFETAQTPQHAGSLSANYTYSPWAIGTLNAHIDITSTDSYSYVLYAPELQRYDAYTLMNARLTLSNITSGSNDHSLSVSVWGRNLTDEEYVVFAFPSAHAFGTPRTAGIDITYKF